MVSPPLALEALSGIKLFLLFEKLMEAGMGLLDLIAARPAMVGQVVRAAKREREINEGLEGFR